MDLTITTALVGCGLFIGMMLCYELGRRIGLARRTRGHEDPAKGAGAAEAAVFGLMGLLIAFTFSGAAERFEARRHLITQEANAIGTAWLRLDLLPAARQGPLRQAFRHYTELRSTAYQHGSQTALQQQALDTSAALQTQIWQQALAASQSPQAAPQAAMLLLPALNEMFDITTTRAMASQNHPPLVVYLLLGFLVLVGALLIGFDTADNTQRSWLHIVVFAAIMALAVFVIVDLEYPRQGLIRVDTADQALSSLLASMKP
jgi:hypothetical protein